MSDIPTFTQSSTGETFGIGCLYEDCRYRPVLCTEIEIEDDVDIQLRDAELRGIDLISGHRVAGCSVEHCGPQILTAAQAMVALADPAAYLRRRMLEDGADADDVSRAAASSSAERHPISPEQRRTVLAEVEARASMVTGTDERSAWMAIIGRFCDEAP